ncbi:MAG: hypothetical protein M1821_009996 [Bathelium mastoideum]|nr:MAG: hypothetical protein M1821_009996 [Bathelium mastoideum]
MANMLAPLRFVQSSINRLLPFTTPGTPVLQDIIHTLILCTVLYFGPSIQQYVQRRFIAREDDTASTGHPPEDTPPNHHDTIQEDPQQIQPIPDEQLVDDPNLAVDDDSEDVSDLEPDFDHNLPNDGPTDDQPPPHDPNAAEAPGPADPPAAHRPPQINPARGAVGAKKARSLARREQRRAYHEFQRSRGDAQRAAEQADAEEREAALYEEKRRRAVAEMEIAARQREEAEARREREQRVREEERRRGETCVRMVREELEREGRVRLGEVARRVGYEEEDGEQWAGRLVRGSGMLGTRREGEEKVVTTMTEKGYVVRVGEGAMREAYKRAADEINRENGQGKISYEEFGGILDQVLKSNATAAA